MRDKLRRIGADTTTVVVVGVPVLLVIVWGLILFWILEPWGYVDKKSVAQVLATSVAGVGLFAQLFLTGRNLAATERNIEQSRDTASQKAELDRRGQITSRFTQSVAQLGSDNIALRLGGIYALEAIAKDSPPDQVTVNEVLTAFIREYSFKTKMLEAESSYLNRKRTLLTTNLEQDIAFGNLEKVTEELASMGREQDALLRQMTNTGNDVDAAIEVLGRRDVPDKSQNVLNLSAVSLENITIGGNFQRVNLMRSTLKKTHFVGTNLNNALFLGASLDSVTFEMVQLKYADFTEATFNNVYFLQVDLRTVEGLTQPLVDSCRFDKHVMLPDGLHLPTNP